MTRPSTEPTVIRRKEVAVAGISESREDEFPSTSSETAQQPIGSTIVLEPRHLRVTYGKGSHAVTAIADITFQVRAGEFLSIVGPSGCGKTTLLKSLSGLLRPTSGDVLVNGTRVDTASQGLAMVFQEYTRSLLPWLSVRANVEFPLRGSRRTDGRKAVERRADEALAEVGLHGVGDKYPWQLSGGMQQRVAIARALAFRPTVLLMDEPFASLDAQARSDLEDLLLKVHLETGMTIVFVTHDIDEAVYLGDRVVVLSHRPTEVKASLDVDLPRPRDQIETKTLRRFVELRTEALGLVLAERSTEAPA
ncbi:ATP-binding cassette domain-containing protein [Actinomadura sp. LD22]|uniref:ATP-binding cassette domain-containing protein n=1 Tax=Actinomadura physcomitrii TaxID=2650748 RepID=A0A6I4MQ33_9ACTN|nr:ABC transporter ATP-binding protein [Actinomadura physcomitrii]MWA04929.1 ATP-binding cassette domain-containing protein [Actinomadura physcomitrii]